LTRLKLEKPVEIVTQAEIADAFASLVTKKEFLYSAFFKARLAL